MHPSIFQILSSYYVVMSRKFDLFASFNFYDKSSCLIENSVVWYISWVGVMRFSFILFIKKKIVS